MYGGGFSTIPAYLADMFGTAYVGAIHGRLLTAWSVAGILGPVLVNYLREYQIEAGRSPAEAYQSTMYVLAGLLLLGLFCTLALRPVSERFFMDSSSPDFAGSPNDSDEAEAVAEAEA
jgi:MFS family permease